MIIEFLLGPAYLKAKKTIQETRYYTRDAHLDFQKKELANLLAFACFEIPYYKKNFSHLAKGISTENAISILERFPFMSKCLIRKEINSLYKPSIIRALKAATGGSSATPMPFYMDRLITRQREKAFMWDQWSRAGYRPGDLIVNFTGNLPESGKVYYYNRLFNKYVFSSFDLVPENMKEIVASLNQISPLFILGYPSVLTTLARLIEQTGEKLSFNPEAIFCESEKTFPRQRQIMESVFETRIYTWYGHSEYAVLGGECEQSRRFHLFPQYGYVEFLETDIMHESGKKLHEIVATGFNNRVMPFIRYKTGDYAILSDTDSCGCGRNYPLIDEVVGRTQEFLVDRDGNLISLTALTSLFEKLSFIDDLYFSQEIPGEFNFFILPARKPEPEEITILKDKIKNATKGRLCSDVQLTEEIPKTGRGKRKLVDQKINLSSYFLKND